VDPADIRPCEGAELTSLRRYILAVFGLLAVLGTILTGVYLTGWGARDGQPDLLRTKKSEHGLFLVSLAPEGGHIRPGELHSWLVTLKTAAGAPVEYAAIDISGGMPPKHNQGLPTSPQATDYLGQGRYRIEGLKFTMDGWWQLRLAISAAAGSDTVVFNVVL
jgi:hypothetical protein